MRNKGIVTVLLAVHAVTCLAQDIHLSQFYEIPLLRNPALAGNFNGLYRVQTAYRNQWQGVYDQPNTSRPYVTAGVGGELKLGAGYCMDDPLTVTLGGQVFVDQAGNGLLKRTSWLLSLTGKWQTNGNPKENTVEKVHLSAGLYGGWVSSGFNFSGLRWGDQFVGGSYSPNNATNQPFPVTAKGYLDFGVGLLSSYKSQSNKRFYLGVACHHFNQPNVGFDGSNDPKNKLPPRFTVNGGILFPSEDERSGLRVYADAMTQGGQNQFLVGAMYKLNLDYSRDIANDDAFSLSGGLFYRFDDAVIPVVNLNWVRVTLGLSYDCRAFRFTDDYRPYGSFEFTLKFRGIIPEKIMKCDGDGCGY